MDMFIYRLMITDLKEQLVELKVELWSVWLQIGLPH